MGKYDHLSDEERRKLAEGLRRAAQSIRATGEPAGERSLAASGSSEELRELPAGRQPESRPLRRRPS